MADIDRTIQYTMTIVDNVSSVTAEQTVAQKELGSTIAQTTELQQETTTAAVEGTAAQQELSQSEYASAEWAKVVAEGTAMATQRQTELRVATIDSSTAIMSQQVNFIAQVQMLRSLHSGILSITMSLGELGLVNVEQEAQLRKVAAAAGLFLGIAQGLKGIQQLVVMLTSAEIAEAAVASYRAVLANPLAVGLVVAGIGAAGVIGAYALSQPKSNSQQTTNVQQTVTFSPNNPAGDQRSVARSSLEAMGGY
jgi:hypothetical protein